MNWHKELAAATTETDVLRLANEYWADVPQGVKELVPWECRSRLLAEGSDLAFWSAALGNRFGADLITIADMRVQELLVFFVRASARVHELRGLPRAANSTLPGAADLAGNDR